MADILIRGMKMPERCDAKCPLYNTGRGYFDCVVTKQSYNWGLLGRPSDCPLVELPEHGDLIDLDERVTKQVFDDYNKEWNMKTKTIRQWLNVDVNEMTVVIPSNKEVGFGDR